MFFFITIVVSYSRSYLNQIYFNSRVIEKSKWFPILRTTTGGISLLLSKYVLHALTQLDFKLHKHLTMKLGRRSTPAVFILFVEGYIFLRLYMRFVYCVARARSLEDARRRCVIARFANTTHAVNKQGGQAISKMSQAFVSERG